MSPSWGPAPSPSFTPPPPPPGHRPPQLSRLSVSRTWASPEAGRTWEPPPAAPGWRGWAERGAEGRGEGRGRRAPGKEPGRRGRISSSPTPGGAWDRGPRREADRRQMAHAGGGRGRLAWLRGALAMGCLSLEEGAENSPPRTRAGSPGGWRPPIPPSPAGSLERGGRTKGAQWGRGVLEERGGGSQAGRPQRCPFPPAGNPERPRGQRWGNRRGRGQPPRTQPRKAEGLGGEHQVFGPPGGAVPRVGSLPPPRPPGPVSQLRGCSSPQLSLKLVSFLTPSRKKKKKKLV